MLYFKIQHESDLTKNGKAWSPRQSTILPDEDIKSSTISWRFPSHTYAPVYPNGGYRHHRDQNARIATAASKDRQFSEADSVSVRYFKLQPNDKGGRDGVTSAPYADEGPRS